MAKEKFDEEDGVWRTVGGRRIFIREGQSLSEAMKASGKFNSAKKRNEKYETVKKDELLEKEKDLQEDEVEKSSVFDLSDDDLKEKLAKMSDEEFNKTVKQIEDELVMSGSSHPYKNNIVTQEYFKRYGDPKYGNMVLKENPANLDLKKLGLDKSEPKKDEKRKLYDDEDDEFIKEAKLVDARDKGIISDEELFNEQAKIYGKDPEEEKRRVRENMDRLGVEKPDFLTENADTLLNMAQEKYSEPEKYKESQKKREEYMKKYDQFAEDHGRTNPERPEVINPEIFNAGYKEGVYEQVENYIKNSQDDFDLRDIQNTVAIIKTEDPGSLHGQYIDEGGKEREAKDRKRYGDEKVDSALMREQEMIRKGYKDIETFFDPGTMYSSKYTDMVIRGEKDGIQVAFNYNKEGKAGITLAEHSKGGGYTQLVVDDDNRDKVRDIIDGGIGGFKNFPYKDYAMKKLYRDEATEFYDKVNKEYKDNQDKYYYNTQAYNEYRDKVKDEIIARRDKKTASKTMNDTIRSKANKTTKTIKATNNANDVKSQQSAIEKASGLKVKDAWEADMFGNGKEDRFKLSDGRIVAHTKEALGQKRDDWSVITGSGQNQDEKTFGSYNEMVDYLSKNSGAYQKAFEEYKKKHPNTKMTLKKFICTSEGK